MDIVTQPYLMILIHNILSFPDVTSCDKIGYLRPEIFHFSFYQLSRPIFFEKCKKNNIKIHFFFNFIFFMFFRHHNVEKKENTLKNM